VAQKLIDSLEQERTWYVITEQPIHIYFICHCLLMCSVCLLVE
jgi:hypothetical protein